MSKLQAVLQQQMAPGVYRFPSRATQATLQEEAEEAGWRLFYLDGTEVDDKASFLTAARDAFAMPGYVGSNWDAFEEAINDLTWAPAAGYAVVFDDAANLDDEDEATFATAVDILNTATENWRQEGKPFYVLVRGAGRTGAELREWPEDATD
jgi:RNAse (barnase) inhibitor barstar